MRGVWLSWREATQRALYGEGGFYRQPHAAARHFRTSVRVSPRFAQALVSLLGDLDEALGWPGELDVVDVGSSGGQLLAGIRAARPLGLRLTAVELAPRPPDLPADVGWMSEMPEGIRGLVVANEWLDNVPVDVVRLTRSGPRLVLVHTVTGQQRLGDPPDEQDLRWLRQWWPLAEVGDIAEIGRPRDEAWARLVGCLDSGLVIAMDYGHLLGNRPRYGSVTGYRGGRQVPPVPDGSCDITSQVALDSCAAATGAHLLTQRVALRALGLYGRRPGWTGADPRGYLRALRTAGEEAELIDPAGLGGFGWLIQASEGCLPARLRATIGR